MPVLQSLFNRALEAADSAAKITGEFVELSSDIVDMSKEASASRKLCKAAKNHRLVEVQNLLKQQVNVNRADKDGFTALMYAAMYGYKEIVDSLLAAGANVHIKNRNGDTALHVATRTNRKEIVQALLDNNASVDQPNYSGDIMLVTAAKAGFLTTVELVLDKTADKYLDSKDNRGDNAVAIVAQRGNIAIMELLIARGARIDLKDSAGNTPLEAAKKNGKHEMVKLIERVLEVHAETAAVENRRLKHEAAQSNREKVSCPRRAPVGRRPVAPT